MTQYPERLRQLWYVPVLGMAMALMMARLVVMARFLDVLSFAHYSGGVLVSNTFCMLACLGLYPLLQRELPMHMVRRRERAGVVLLAQCFLVATMCAVAGLLPAAAGISVMGLPPFLLVVGMLHGLSQQVFLVVTLESRSRGLPLQFARQNLERAGMALALGSGVGIVFDSALAVLLVEAAISTLLTIKIFKNVLRRSRIQPRLAFLLATRRMAKIPWTSAMALMAVAVISFAFVNADRWVAAQWLQPPAFALYAFAWIVLLVAQSLQAVISAAFFPMLARRFVLVGPRAAFRLCAIASIGLLLLGLLVSWPAGRFLDLVVPRWFPGYTESLGVMNILLWVAALRVSDFWGSYLIILGKEARLLVVYFFVGVLVVLTWMSWVQPWAKGAITIESVAWLAVSFSVTGQAALFMTATLYRNG